MGRTIDEHIAQLKKLKSFHNGSYGASINFALDTMRKYQMMQAAYENRLKADLVAMLKELQSEIREVEVVQDEPKIRAGELCLKGACIDLIQQKIHALKAESENEYFNGNFNDAREFLDKATTIIEADKGDKDD